MTKIYHNPRCGTSRTVLQALLDHGEQPEIIEYLNTPPSREQIETLIRDAGLSVRDALRSKEPAFQALSLDDASLTDSQLLDAVAENPILLNRPFVVTAKGTRLCRPAELVQDIL